MNITLNPLRFLGIKNIANEPINPATEDTQQRNQGFLSSILEVLRSLFRERIRITRDGKAVIDTSETAFGATLTTVVNATSNPITGIIFYTSDAVLQSSRSANTAHSINITRY